MGAGLVLTWSAAEVVLVPTLTVAALLPTLIGEEEAAAQWWSGLPTLVAVGAAVAEAVPTSVAERVVEAEAEAEAVAEAEAEAEAEQA